MSYTPNWTRTEFEREVNKAFFVNNNDLVSLDTERSDYQNVQDMLRWGRAMGYKTEEFGETVRVYKLSDGSVELKQQPNGICVLKIGSITHYLSETQILQLTSQLKNVDMTKLTNLQ